MTRRAAAARRKGRDLTGPTVEQRRRKNVPRGTSKGLTLERRQARPEFNNGIRNQGLRKELRLGSKATFYEVLGQTTGLESVKQTVGTSIRLRKMCIRTLWRGRPPREILRSFNCTTFMIMNKYCLAENWRQMIDFPQFLTSGVGCIYCSATLHHSLPRTQPDSSRSVQFSCAQKNWIYILPQDQANYLLI
jgi:hypothetical protein